MISVVIPTYNERENISILIPKVYDILKREGAPFEIVAVDDSSPDGTAEWIKEMGGKYNCRVIVRETRMGIGSAHAVGYNNAKGDIILTMDADLSHSPEEIPLLLENLKEVDVVLGSRHLEGSIYERKKIKTRIKNLVSTWGNTFIRLCLGVGVHDYSNGFRCFKKKVWNSITVEEKGNAFLMEFVTKAHRAGFKIVEVPTSFFDRRFGKSKLNLSREAVNILIRVMYLSFKQ